MRQPTPPLGYKSHQKDSHSEIGARVLLERTFKKDWLGVRLDK